MADDSAPWGNITKEQALQRLDSMERLVEMRMDVFKNETTGLAGRNSKTGCTQWAGGIRLSRFVLEDMYEFNPMMTRIISREPIDAIEPGFTVNQLSEEQQADTDDFLDRRGFSEHLMEAGTWERLQGGAAIFMEIDDGQDPSLPVDINNIREFGHFTVLDRWELYVSSWSTDLRAGQFLTPSMYQLTEGGQFVHPSRLLIFPGIKLPRRRMQNNQGWGGSTANAVVHKLQQWDTTGDYLAEAVVRHSQGVLKFQNLKKSLTEEKGADINARIQALGRHMGLMGDVVLDANETYEVVNRGMTGFAEANGVAVDGMVAVTDQPKSILMGLTIGGLNSGDNAGDWQTWTSHLGGVQKRKYQRNVLRVLRYVYAAQNSPIVDVPERLVITWRSLFQLSEQDKAEITSKYASAAQMLVLSNAMFPHQVGENEQISEAFKLEQISEGDEEEESGRGEEIDPAEEAELIAQGGVPGATPGAGEVQDTALNDAQIASLVGIVTGVTEGLLTESQAIQLIKISFPSVTPEEAVAVFNGRTDAVGQDLTTSRSIQLIKICSDAIAKPVLQLVSGPED